MHCKKNRLIIFLLFTAFFRMSGKASESTKSMGLSFVSWNVQTFFDGVKDGTEYSEFLKSSQWTKEKYLTRLNRLCNVMLALNADVYAFEEIENAQILQDISNQLQGGSWKSRDKWNYGCFAKDENAAIGIAVISKYPLENMKIHNMDLQCQKSSQPSVRPILQVTVNTGSSSFELFVNHWKSKSGGECESEIWRDWQESILSSLIKKEAGKRIVVCGDFNRNAADFFCDFTETYSRNSGQLFDCCEGNTVLRQADFGSQNYSVLYSPWFNDKGEYAFSTGSYYFNSGWEYIDNIFCTGNVRLTAFKSAAMENWTTEEGIPKAYSLYTEEGCSDHLPLMCTIILD